MNLSNISALAISIPLENLSEKIREIQDLHFEIEDIHITLEDRIRLLAKLISSDKPKQTYDEIDPLLQTLMKQIQEKRDAKRIPYVW